MVNRYHANRTGTFFIGEPPAQYVDLMGRLAGAYDVLRERAKAGTPVREVSGQDLVPVLVDGDRVLVDSTRILHHLEERVPAAYAGHP